MPTIQASVNGTHASGDNLEDRSLFAIAFDPDGEILRRLPRLHAQMRALRHEGKRSAFSCAEADAFADLLRRVRWQQGQGRADFAAIRWSRPTSDDGQVLWHPCANCSVWLEPAEGWGPQLTYRLTPFALDLV